MKLKKKPIRKNKKFAVVNSDDDAPKGNWFMASFEDLVGDKSWVKLTESDSVSFDCGYIKTGKLEFIDGYHAITFSNKNQIYKFVTKDYDSAPKKFKIMEMHADYVIKGGYHLASLHEI